MSASTDLTLLDPVLQKHLGQDDALITILQEIQDIYSYLPEEVLVRLSQEVKIPMSRVYAVATFYAQFCYSKQISIVKSPPCVEKGKAIMGCLVR